MSLFPMSMKHIIYILTFIAALFSVTACTDNMQIEGSDSGVVLNKGELVNAFLNISVDGLAVSMSTRADGEEVVPEDDNEAERQVKDLWILQYDSETGQLLNDDELIYTEISDQSELLNVPVALYDNEGEPCYIYVITNTLSGSWLTGKSVADFNTIDKLKALALPIREPMFDTDDELDIPMQGSSEEVTVQKDESILVPVTRTYAKVMIRVNITLDRTVIYNVGVGNIPEYCQVGSLAEGLSSDEEAAEYGDIQWISRSFPAATVVPDDNDSDDGTDNSYPYVIYVPENLQGKGATKDETGANAPTDALAINVVISNTDAEGGTMQYPYTVYPGADVIDDYNIKRNTVYRVTVNISELSVARVPSANSFVVNPGETLAFYPYYRVETGGGYDFTTYLDPTGENGEKIDKVEILWQTQDCIGDNSDGDLVWIAPNSETHDGYEKIYVKTQKEGNALVVARNSSGDIIWSWHIWVTSNDPANEANAQTYYTYAWDEDGIKYNDERISGYQIMPCNLGALKNTPDDDDDLPNTYGMLYQWGRKDPFPPLTNHGHTSTTADGGYVAHDYTVANTQVLYANDNKTEVDKTNTEDNTKLFHSISGTHINEESDGITYTIQNPTVFLCGTYEVNQSETDGTNHDGNNSLTYVQTLSNYINGGAWSEDDHDNKLWGGLEITSEMKCLPLDIFYRDKDNNEVTEETENYENYRIHIYDNYGDAKSIFDPCPYGWRVSSSDLWLGFSRTGSNPETMDDVNYDVTATGSSLEGMYMYLGQKWRSGETTFFPCQGFRLADGCGYRVSGCGNYSNANTDANDKVNTIHIHNNAANFKIFEPQTGYTVKSVANPVRCVRDTK